ncbi:hypothetical protein CONCODRAFT_72063 [Conidiobolus coronatus NRRL 28638]|uniref:Extracellular membrane protein CFEM domain-containing protein n=1 Tax=Conidiobolus coronatus (strain ATCC 28846 / CBS 209.66 / NRRL 28638) TaxID=796925 RepID=A0A137P0Z7_CONC2|nr:hypothetical protein CONCODRAFT_72063 [Conidiobolus coronatus NRRL 28638]|eukprot:KXN68717.1 hypothetical protein CONCODRAFT_72063 [Conidiobolus coronatus NRRL 28638]
MNLTTTLILLASSVFSQDKSTSTSNTCLSKFECKFSEAAEIPENQSKLSQCSASITEIQSKSCVFIAYGLNPNQAQSFIKLSPQLDKCSSVTKDTKYTSCMGQCTGDNKDECVEKCKAPVQVEYVNCLAKLANQGNFDTQKAVDCSNKCEQNSLVEIYDCDYSCKKSIYDSLITDSSSASNSNSTFGSSDANGNSSKDTKASSSTKSGSSGKSSAITNLNLNSFSVISVATLVFAIIV